ncbi:MAG: twin-arginine translocation signal domain-containing protein, partial [Pirellulales bacterium]|nr:twin-arginine translocation signal domain-containing protein [Pirellulales bacterium]
MDSNRRQFLQTTAVGAGTLALTSATDPVVAASAKELGPRRFIFIRKSSGIRPLETALADFSDSDKALDEKKQPIEVDLGKHELPKWLRGLDAHKKHMTVLQGLSAKMSENVHWSFSSVMGCFKSNRNTLSAIKRTT